MLRDLRFGWRSLRKQPAFLAIAITTLALCIGANTAIFTVVDATLLRPLPYRDPDRLLIVQEVDLGRDAHSSLSYPDYQNWSRAKSLEELAVYRSDVKSVSLPGARPFRALGMLVSSSYLHIFGIEPLLGRTFSAEEELAGAAPTVVVSEHFWREHLHGKADIVGKTILLDAVPYTVVGVMPMAFRHPTQDADIWIPLMSDAEIAKSATSHGNYFLNAIGRLKPGSSITQLSAELDAIVANDSEKSKSDGKPIWTPKLTDFSDYQTRRSRNGLWLIFGAVGIVLLIGCANLANLLQARGATRQKEIALRLAIGAPRGRIVRQLLTESMLLSVLGGVAGLFLGWWLIDGLAALAPSELFSRLGATTLGARAFAFNLALSLVVGASFGALPAISATDVTLQDALKDAGNKFSAGKHKRHVQRSLIVAQIVLALFLAFSAALVVHAFAAQTHIDPGFSPDGVLSARVSLPASRYDEDKRVPFFAQLLARAEAQHELGEVALSDILPFSGHIHGSNVEIDGKAMPPEGLEPNVLNISDNFFSVLKIRQLSGRPFTRQECLATDEQARKLSIINQTLAKMFWPDDPLHGPLGEYLKASSDKADDEKFEIIGVVADVEQDELGAKPEPQVYFPFAQWHSRDMELLSRSPHPDAAASALRRVVEDGDPNLAIGTPSLLASLVARSLSSRRFVLVLLAAFAALALVLSAVGIYGVTAYNVGQRTREIGIRIALGAGPRDVQKLLFGETAKLLAVGITGGSVAAFLGMRILRHVVSEVAFRPDWLLAVAILVVLVMLVATYIPTRRALRIDPQVALRSE
jgi:putative ABC transport system permease protein